ncbi:hypothetical protein [Marinobacterium litorale]|jgi:site-specific recombinase XerD|nr:hypothetical protein [Marinobacterium litorale]
MLLIEECTSSERSALVGKEGTCHPMRHASATYMLNHGAYIRYVDEL